uniref:Uncharacterized protein n=1 Tax=Rhizophora mucronata TaxID=61149 RepID=A0A2P2PHP3_RHIMU
MKLQHPTFCVFLTFFQGDL